MSDSPYIKLNPKVFSNQECERILELRRRDSTVDGKLTDFLVFKDEAKGDWVEILQMIEERMMPLLQSFGKEFLSLLPVKHLEISHIGFLNDDFGSFTELHYDWEMVMVKEKLIPKPIVMLIYLTDVEEGGSLFFPVQKVEIKPAIGNTVIFPSNFCFPHLSTPVLKGSKHVCRVTIKLPPKMYQVDSLEI